MLLETKYNFALSIHTYSKIPYKTYINMLSLYTHRFCICFSCFSYLNKLLPHVSRKLIHKLNKAPKFMRHTFQLKSIKCFDQKLIENYYIYKHIHIHIYINTQSALMRFREASYIAIKAECNKVCTRAETYMFRARVIILGVFNSSCSSARTYATMYTT